MHGMTVDQTLTYLVVDAATGATATVDDRRLARFTERHPFHLEALSYAEASPLQELRAPDAAAGVVFVLEHGVPGRRLLDACARILRQQRGVFFYWPGERAAEVIDREALGTYWRLLLATRIYAVGARLKRIASKLAKPRHAAEQATALKKVGEIADLTPALGQVGHIAAEADSLRAHNAGGFAMLRGVAGQCEAYGAPDLRGQIEQVIEYLEGGLPGLDRIAAQARTGVDLIHALGDSPVQAPLPLAPAASEPTMSPAEAMEGARALISSAAPTPFKLERAPTPEAPLQGAGVYLRLDFWAPLTSGGSYGHTVYQAKALSRTTRDFAAIVANPFKTFETLGVRQVVLQPRRREGNEGNIVDANRFYYERLKPVFAALQPAFVFERLVLGNLVGAKLCREFGIPYIAEYNGSEISMMRSFSDSGYENEEMFLAAEEAAFKQATLISVVSEHVGADVARRGVPESRILLNPNAVDLAAYAPPTPQERGGLRAELGIGESERVVAFIGTFGGWHGIDVLAEALPAILERAPEARFLLIGDGIRKPLVREAIENHGLGARVIDAGRVPQSEGARLLKVADVLVSPHSSHMVDSRFFGSPTKLFEYMAMSAGIVASDLEQIGEVLAPSLRVNDVRRGAKAGDARALVCKPGDVEEFVEATLALVRDPALAQALGANARAAAERYYSWDQHVADLWAVLAGMERRGFHADLAAKTQKKGAA